MRRFDFDRTQPVYLSSFGCLIIARQGRKVALAIVDERQDTILVEDSQAERLRKQAIRYRSWTKRNARVRAARLTAEGGP